jgi:hypothetical protein
LKKYKSLEEIDQHLKILRLQADIYKKRTQIHSKLVKHSLRPSNLIAEVIVMLGEKYLWNKVFQMALNKFTNKLKK